ncbi:LapA family protein [Myxacorys almedinensis]|uniref:DUF1049 domain-containing protein n=1 Tax=Myxacorys almedinensis A TaxID=2690445 RepID=A0A8J8CIU9_9CYAN|nr:LapA family protein [Myxacorys almedinensis]NDJ18318.1 DUF1049 domain-containing protein [Myxacorys almedinensis A]
MKSLATLITACILGGWVAAIALISVQNAAPVSFRFLTFQTIELPFGLVLAFSTALGMIGAAIVQPLLGSSPAASDREND